MYSEFKDITPSNNFPHYVATCGNQSAPSVLFLHGFLMSHAIWNDNMTELSEHIRPILVEHLGHGRSTAPISANAYSIEAHIERIETIRVHLGIEKWFLCGHSFGAGICLHYANSKPEHTLGVVFTNSKSAVGDLGDQMDSDATQKLFQALEDNPAQTISLMPHHPKHMRHISTDVKSALTNDASLISGAGLIRLMKETAPNTNAIAILADIKVPVLLINGKKENGFQEDRNKLAVEQPTIQIADVEAGHSPNAEIPDEFNSILMNFINAHSDNSDNTVSR